MPLDVSAWLVVIGVAVLLAVVAAYLILTRNQPGPRPPPTPPPQPPPTPGIPPCEIPPDRAGNVMWRVYNPSRLTIYEDCNYGKGVVESVSQESDGDYHIRVNCDSDSPVQAKGSQYLVCEIIPFDQQAGLKAPNVGDRVVMYGPHVFDTIHGWDEIHPVWKILTL